MCFICRLTTNDAGWRVHVPLPPLTRVNYWCPSNVEAFSLVADLLWPETFTDSLYKTLPWIRTTDPSLFPVWNVTSWGFMRRAEQSAPETSPHAAFLPMILREVGGQRSPAADGGFLRGSTPLTSGWWSCQSCDLPNLTQRVQPGAVHVRRVWWRSVWLIGSLLLLHAVPLKNLFIGLMNVCVCPGRRCVTDPTSDPHQTCFTKHY